MNFYYQHIGEELAARDLPRSIGTVKDGPLNFTVSDLRQRFEIDRYCSETDLHRLESQGDYYQVWGFPSGAERTIKDIGPDDYLMLMGSKFFDVISRVAYRVPEFAHNSSKRIWGEDRFPVIVLLKESCFISLPFALFSRKLGFDEAYHMRGNTMKVGPARIISSGLMSADGLASWCKREGAN